MVGFWHRWMVVWCWCVILFGLVFALIPFDGLRVPAMLFIDLVFWPLDGEPALLSREATFAMALVGALTIGLGAVMLGLVGDPELSHNPAVWRHMTRAVVLWFVVDSGLSIVCGAPVNAVSNTVLLATYLAGATGHRSAREEEAAA